MRKVNRAIAAAIIAAGIVGGTYAFFGSPLVPVAHAGWKEHPRLEKAHDGVKDAVDYLVAAPHDFHGHREEAVKALKRAQEQLEICAEIRAKADPNPSLLEEHPRLRHTKEVLKDARAYLHDAPHDFHGHRVEAIKAIDEAIEQIDLCMKE